MVDKDMASCSSVMPIELAVEMSVATATPDGFPASNDWRCAARLTALGLAAYEAGIPVVVVDGATAVVSGTVRTDG